MRRTRVSGVVIAGLLIVGSLAAAAPVAARGHVRVVLEGLSSPKAIAAGDGQEVFVGQGWFFGPPGPVLAVPLTGRHRGTPQDVTDPLSVVDIAGTPDGAGWAIGADATLYRMAGQGAAVEPVLDIAAYQAGDLDPYNNPEEDPAESNPNGLAAVGWEDVLIADAAGNDLLRVAPDGSAHTVARWQMQEVGTDHLGDPELPPTMDAEAVPTTVAIGRDGWAYVGQLVGYPGKPGSAHIFRVNPNAVDAECSVTEPNDECAVWKSGFTSIFDIAFNPNNGRLYVYEIAEDGWLALEEAFVTGDFPPAVLLEVKGNKRREMVRGELSQPGGIVVLRNGRIFVTDGMFGNGRLSELTGH